MKLFNEALNIWEHLIKNDTFTINLYKYLDENLSDTFEIKDAIRLPIDVPYGAEYNKLYQIFPKKLTMNLNYVTVNVEENDINNIKEIKEISDVHKNIFFTHSYKFIPSNSHPIIVVTLEQDKDHYLTIIMKVRNKYVTFADVDIEKIILKYKTPGYNIDCFTIKVKDIKEILREIVKSKIIMFSQEIDKILDPD